MLKMPAFNQSSAVGNTARDRIEMLQKNREQAVQVIEKYNR